MTKQETLKQLEALGASFMESRQSEGTGKPLAEMAEGQWKGIFLNPSVRKAKRLAAYRLWAPLHPGHDLVPELLDITSDEQVQSFFKGQDEARRTKIQG